MALSAMTACNPPGPGNDGGTDGGTGTDSGTDSGTGAEFLTVHYYRPLGDYTGWTLQATGDVDPTGTQSPLAAQGSDTFGTFYRIPLRANARTASFTIKNGTTQAPANALTVDLTADGKEVWVYSEGSDYYTAAPAIPADGTAVIYYRRADAQYQGWGLYVFGDTPDTPPNFNQPLQPTGTDAFGAYFVIRLAANAQQVGLIVHNNGNKDPGPDQFLRPPTQGRRLWIVSGDTNVYTYPAAPPIIDATRAHWVSRDTIAWDLPGTAAELAARTYTLHYSSTGGIHSDRGRIVGATGTLTLTYDPTGLSPALAAQFPHLATFKTLKIAAADLARVPDILRGQFVISSSATGSSLIATGLQIPGVLDDLYTYTGPLGATISGNTVTLRVWAPTAQLVKLYLYPDTQPSTLAQIVLMTRDDATGVWTATGDASWKNQYYLYYVNVYAPSTGQIETNLVTDPYSLSLSANSKRSQIVDLNDPALKPTGWDTLAKPQNITAPEDIAVWELHVRDFSANDATVTAANRGTYLAFTEGTASGVQHLRQLATAGLTHVHLQPVFDFATVDEVRANWQFPPDLSGFAADGQEQQAAIGAIRDTDPFNWGYDPLHYTVPEGSYATQPDGPARIREFRSMVQAINNAGLRVVVDVVYNHTSASGQDPKSIFDRIVPGYYHRLDLRGNVANSTCCSNTASEHAMFGRLMVDSVRTWATAYKVDGFRFDLMGHHLRSNMMQVRDALQALTPAQDGVDGSQIYIYGEGWDFGEVAGNARGVNATQANLSGTGIGTFNDRIRDAVRGGGAFDSGQSLMRQGFSNGLFVAPNSFGQGTPAEQKARLLDLEDQIRVSLAGNLKTYQLVNSLGTTVTGADVQYNGAPAGYTSDPQEVINYASVHDNETLFDILQYKAPDTADRAARVRMHNLAVSVIALGQGVPFFLAGDELLRSKSLDRDSYNSGDWFNRLDFTYQSNNWGVGLPPQGANGNNWSVIQPLLADPARKPTPADIQAAFANFREMLQIRKSSPLFRLRTAADVSARVRYLNTGAQQTPGLIVMLLADEGTGVTDIDPARGGLVVLFNATPSAVTFSDATLTGATLALHPVQQSSADPIVRTATFTGGTFNVPAWTTAVFSGTLNLP
jgi:pullulanase